jgi:esterase/lipase superfamily enzyme
MTPMPGTSISKNGAVYISSTTTTDPHTYNLIKINVTQVDWLNDISKKYNQVMVFVHGFGNTAEKVVARHESVKPHVPDGFALVSFDWPSGNGGFMAYADDQENAANSARVLISACLAPLVEKFTSKNVHLFAHSMGALVTETAFAPMNNPGNWKINHVLLAAGDVDASNYKC